MDYAKCLVAWMDGGAAGDVRILSEASVAEALTPSSVGGRGLSWSLSKVEGFGSLFTFEKGGGLGTLALAVPEHNLVVLYFMQSQGDRNTWGEFHSEALQALVN